MSAVTKKDAQPLPRIDDTLDVLAWQVGIGRSGWKSVTGKKLHLQHHLVCFNLK